MKARARRSGSGKERAPERRSEVYGHIPKLTRWGKTFKIPTSYLRSHRGRGRSRHDVTRHTSDDVWALVEKMLAGDAEAVPILSDLIEEGVSSGKTKFIDLGTQGFGKTDRSFAAITPGRQITLFGVRTRSGWEKGRGHFTYVKPYVSRYKIGDAAEYSSYNLVYFGTITSISDKRVMIDKGHGSGKASLTIDRFSTKNWDPENLEKGLKQNREWTD